MCGISELADSLIAKAVKLAEERNDTRYYATFSKLHKLLYIAQGWMLSQHGIKMFRAGEISARACGPYIKVLDPYFWEFGEEPIQTLTREVLTFPQNVEDTLDAVLEALGQESWPTLSFATRRHEVVRRVYKPEHDEIISEDALKAYFEKFVPTLEGIVPSVSALHASRSD